MTYDRDLRDRLYFVWVLVAANFVTLVYYIFHTEWFNAIASATWMGTALFMVQGCKLDQESRDRLKEARDRLMGKRK